jgi:hypothetical protein
METLLAKSFNFSVSVTEMVIYLKEENKEFPLAQRLLDCGTGICLSLRAAQAFPKNGQLKYEQAILQTVTFHYLMELMVKTGAITELQSRRLLDDCDCLRYEIADLLANATGIKKRGKQTG